MRPRTPPEKKQLSLRKDRRNVYGESPHGARKDIPGRKKRRNRANRHQQESKLPATPALPEDVDPEEIEASIRGKAPQRWSKLPDAPLGDVIAGKQRRRVASHGRKLRSKALKAFRDGHFHGKCPGCGVDVFVLSGRHGGEHYGAFCGVGQGMPNPTFAKVAIRPGAPGELPEAARELYASCVDSGDSRLGDWVCRLFGAATCPQCREPFDVAKAVAASDGLRRVYSASGAMSCSPPEWRTRLRQWLYYQP